MRIRVESSAESKLETLATFAHLTTRWLGPICDSISISYAILFQPGWLLAVAAKVFCNLAGNAAASKKYRGSGLVSSGLAWLGLPLLGLAWPGLGCGSIPSSARLGL
ncbi:hypothetical protein AWZ03_012079 [Drosophila navojoa]|uniref:Uncharacterized protein n=1 Tax=Drosophila navojoa TaxID=7232 RepID=A0A484AZT9_DRONA|nr:hypothetical protein AWZ03_012079 [Drosophila navojoa]